MDELDDAGVGSCGWMERLQWIADDVEALLADMLAETWERLAGENSRNDWAEVVRREYSASELASWRERLAEAYARPVSPEELDLFRHQLRQERGPR
jgi:hypothetical protein